MDVDRIGTVEVEHRSVEVEHRILQAGQGEPGSTLRIKLAVEFDASVGEFDPYVRGLNQIGQRGGEGDPHGAAFTQDAVQTLV